MAFAPQVGIRTVALLATLLVLLASANVFRFFAANSRLNREVAVDAEFYGARSSTGALHDAIYRDARRLGVPLDRDDINITTGPSGPEVNADYRVTADLHLFQFPMTMRVRYPAHNEIFSPFHRLMLSMLGLVFGFYLFSEGFVLFWRYRLFADTPVTPIRSVAMGRVEVSGKAVGEKTLSSPVSNQPCFLYLVHIDRWVTGRSGSGHWSRYLVDEVGIRFYLEDDSGRVLVDPREAEYDLQESFQCEISKQEVLFPGDVYRSEEHKPSLPGQPATHDELRSYVQQVADGVDTGLFHGADWPAEGFAKAKHKKPRRVKRSFGIILSGLSLASPFGALGGGFDHAPGDYRLTEFCILPGTTYDILGTCAENQDSKSEADRHIILKGRNEPTFLISNRSEKYLEAYFRGRAMRNIVGGSLLAIGSTAALLEVFGLLI